MFDIGIGEIALIAVIALFVFGPDRLPKAAADAGRWVRNLREMASGARKDLADSAGLDLSEAMDTMRSLQDLHPRRLATSLMSDEPLDKPAAKPPVTMDPDAT
ncbi:MAG: Sec-independent protein translocase protein TatB [Candidatus Nanopelagicales bacterium]|jgi:sec-independent protein translocase protein TatB|nr:Sec-independent protein translocase protein TatB [Candidatus Nanopelagicales bacterium]